MLIDPTIKTVVFDADDTLFRVSPSVTTHYKNILLQFGKDIPETDISASLTKNWKALFPLYLNEKNGYATSIERETNFWFQFARQIVMDCVRDKKNDATWLDHVAKSLYDHFALGSTRVLQDKIREILEKLCALGVTLGVFTNNDQRIHSVLEGLKIAHYFSFIEHSGSVGFKKPSINVFKTLESRYGFVGREALYIGNTKELDVEPALKAGWQAMLINDF